MATQEEPAGFPNCQVCPYFQSGPADVCSRCVAETNTVAPNHCPTCSQRLDPGESCRNILCRPGRSRSIDTVNAIAEFRGPLGARIKRLKYQGKWAWAVVFGRLIVGWLDDNVYPGDYDRIVANPTAVDREYRHTERILKEAWLEDFFEEWPFDHPDRPTVVKTRPTTASAGGNWGAKVAAADEVYDALKVTRDVSDESILVIDDVATTLLQLDAVARKLRDAGATRVEGLVIARTPWTG